MECGKLLYGPTLHLYFTRHGNIELVIFRYLVSEAC